MSVGETVVLQQLVNGLSLGMMYALLALGFTMVYGIIELINFAHFNVFMAGTFFGLWFLAFLGYGRGARPITDPSLAVVLITAFAVTMLLTGLLGAVIERLCLKAMRATAQDPEAARMMGIRIDVIILLTFFIGSALAGAAAVIFGIYYGLTSYIVGYLAGLRAFTAAVVGGIGNIPGAVLGGLLIG